MKSQLNKYLHQVRKMHQIIVECSQGKLDYIQYLDFFKSMDKDIIKCLVTPLRTQHK
jgi:hypothetical protein